MSAAGRFIPTGVGNAEIGRMLLVKATVHPHGCGERCGRSFPTQDGYGSSPRVWGTLLISGASHITVRFIPTGVGNAILRRCGKPAKTVHPHGCGERMKNCLHIRRMGGSSPRVWGTHSIAKPGHSSRRFIPTGVGNAFYRQ